MPSFYKSIIKLWIKMYSIEPTNTEQIVNEVIWKNRFIICNKETLCWDAWIKQGIWKIKHLLDDQGNFLSHTELSARYRVNCSFLHILQIRQSIPKPWLHKILENNKVYPDQQGPRLLVSGIYKSVHKLKCKDYY